VDDKNKTVAALGDGSRQKGRFKESSRRMADGGGDDKVGEDPRRQL
jgi:hypothetical protein